MRYLFAILALGLLIAVHEFGHLLFARLCGIRVDRFSFGFGPPIVTFKRRGIEWRLGAIPLGGSVVVHGMNPHAEGDLRVDRSSFAARSPWIRALVLASGSIVNFLLALAVLVALFVQGTHVPVGTTVGTVEPGSEAARAQLRPGDEVVAINGEPLSRWSDLVSAVAEHPGQPLTLTVSREGETQTIEVTPRSEGGEGRLGLSQQYVYREHAFGPAVGLAFEYTGRLLTEGAGLIWRVVRGRPDVDLESPIGIVKQASDTARSGVDAFLRVLVSLSVALAIFHLLPIPSLDGGRILFTVIEGITGWRLPPRLETLLNTVGLLLLIAAVLFIAARDLTR